MSMPFDAERRLIERGTMTTEIVEREPTLYITDAELIRRMGVPEKTARMVIRALDADRKSGFPPKDAFFGGRRYWPAVRAYLDRRNRVNVEPPPKRGSP